MSYGVCLIDAFAGIFQTQHQSPPWLHRQLCTVSHFLFVGSEQSITHVHVEPNICHHSLAS